MKTKNIEPKKVFFGSLKTTLNKIVDDTNPVIEALYADVEKYGIQPAGPLEFIYHGATGDMDKEFDLEIALPVAQEIKPEWSQFSFKNTNEFKCVSEEYKGSLEHIYGTYERIFGELDKGSMKSTDEVREVYQNWVSFSSDENIVEIQIGIN